MKAQYHSIGKKQRVFLLLLTFFIQLACFHSQAREILSLTSGEIIMGQRLSPVIRNISVTENENIIDVTYQFSDIGHDKDCVSGSSVWFLDGFNQSTSLGKPSLPINTDIIHIPSYMTPTVSVIDSCFIDIPSVLAPAKKTMTENQSTLDEIIPIEPYDGFFPNSSVWINHTGSYRGEQLLYIGISPVKYDLNNSISRILKSITYRISLHPKNDLNALTIYKNNAPLIITTKDDNLINNIALNSLSFSKSKSFLKSKDTTYDTTPLLIITHPNHSESVRQLAHWKRVLGFDVTILSRNYWTPDTIKSEISKQTIKNPNLKYILILGSHEQIPAEFVSDRNIYTDFYYSVSPNNDNEYPIPDYAIGRLPAHTSEQSLTMVKKIMDYERIPPTDKNFYSTTLNSAGFDCVQNFQPHFGKVNSMEMQRFIKRSEEVRDYLSELGYNVNRAYKKVAPHYNPTSYNPDFCTETDLKMPDDIFCTNYAWDASADDVMDAINKGCLAWFISYHGTETSVENQGTVLFENSDLNKLSNGSKLPVVFSINCKTGSFQKENTFLTNLLSIKDGGAVAAYGFTNDSYTIYNDCLLAGMMDAIWPIPGFRIKPAQTNGIQTPAEPTFRLGDILIQAKAVMNSFDIWTNNSNYCAKASLEMLHCLGDPTMEIRTEHPSVINNEVSIRRINGNVMVVTNKPAYISFFNETTDEVVQVDGTSAEYRCVNPDNITVCVNRHNCIPFIDYAPVSPYIQNKSISADYTIQADKIILGSDILLDKNQGSVSIGDEAIFSAKTKEIIFGPGVDISEKATINIEISE